jgi:hypothetical protein
MQADAIDGGTAQVRDGDPVLDTRGHLLLPDGPGPLDALAPGFAVPFGFVRDEARFAAGLPGWTPVLTVGCPTCGRRVGFSSTPCGDGFSFAARDACPSPGGLRHYAVRLAVPSGVLVAADDLSALANVESRDPSGDLAERALDRARAAAGIATVRTGAHGAVLRRRQDLVLVGHPPGPVPLPPDEGLGPDDAPLPSPSGFSTRVDIMDRDLFLARCAREGLDPARFGAAMVAVPPGTYGVLLRPPRRGAPLGVHAVIALTDEAAAPVRDPAFGEDVRDGHAFKVLRELARVSGSPFGGLANALCAPSGRVWSNGLLRAAPRPPDAAPSLPCGASGRVPAAWEAVSPPLPGSPAEAAATVRVRMSWSVPPLHGAGYAPIQEVPDGVHPHWLAAAALFSATAAGRPDLFHDRGGGVATRQVRRMGAIARDLAARVASRADRASVESAMDQWRGLGPDDWA